MLNEQGVPSSKNHKEKEMQKTKTKRKREDLCKHLKLLLVDVLLLGLGVVLVERRVVLEEFEQLARVLGQDTLDRPEERVVLVLVLVLVGGRGEGKTQERRKSVTTTKILITFFF